MNHLFDLENGASFPFKDIRNISEVHIIKLVNSDAYHYKFTIYLTSGGGTEISYVRELENEVVLKRKQLLSMWDQYLQREFLLRKK